MGGDLDRKFAAETNAIFDFVKGLEASPIALFTADANEQHYEVETKFYDLALGKRKKYSSGMWPSSSTVASASGPALETAEDEMLDLYVQRAGVKDGMNIIDLGCGWGSVSLYLAEKFPNAKITGISNSKTQRAYILGQAKERGFGNVDVQTMNVAGPAFEEFLAAKKGTIDRIISIEMFEHMKNYGKLLKLLSGALVPDGKLFVHIFCHKYMPFHFEEEDTLNAWMTKQFFKGGTMPSQFLLHYFNHDLAIQEQWNVNGMNYTLSLEGWLQRMDQNEDKILDAFRPVYGEAGARLQFRRWRMFMLVCAEFFKFRGGSEFFVTHMLFAKQHLQG